MHRLDSISREKLVDGLATFFYAAMALAFLTALMGSPGWGFLMLLLGACALVVRTPMEATMRRPEAERDHDRPARAPKLRPRPAPSQRA
jgi:hypothetical protein